MATVPQIAPPPSSSSAGPPQIRPPAQPPAIKPPKPPKHLGGQLVEWVPPKKKPTKELAEYQDDANKAVVAKNELKVQVGETRDQITERDADRTTLDMLKGRTNKECTFFREQQIDKLKSTYPDSSKPWVDMQRFHIEIFQESHFKNRLTQLKDSPEQNVSVLVRPSNQVYSYPDFTQ